jgi:hypothetical protein
VAERVRFELTVVLPTHAFQACALNHSAISPPSAETVNLYAPPGNLFLCLAAVFLRFWLKEELRNSGTGGEFIFVSS